MRMIDADKFKEELLKLWDYSTVDVITATTVIKQVISALDNCPTVAINCKDCDGYEAGYNAGYADGIRGADWSGDYD